MHSHKTPCVLLLLACLAGVVLAQTFQYSRGWTNGRKRGGPAIPGLLPGEEPAPCQLQRLRLLLEGRNSPQLYVPCEMWRISGDNAVSDDVNDRFRRRLAINEIVPSLKNVNDVEEI